MILVHLWSNDFKLGRLKEIIKEVFKLTKQCKSGLRFLNQIHLKKSAFRLSQIWSVSQLTLVPQFKMISAIQDLSELVNGKPRY